MTATETATELLRGAVDLHLHAGPDVKPRVQDAVAVAIDAAAAGMRAIVLKDHQVPTTDRAAWAAAAAPGVAVFGGLVLNLSVGGLNPYAVDAAIRRGARVVWFPTQSAASHLRARGRPHDGGLSVFEGGLDAPGALRPEVTEICRRIAEAGIVLATGHLHASEVVPLVAHARSCGVERIVVTHPENRAVDLHRVGCVEVTRQGAVLELVYRSRLKGDRLPLGRLVEIVRWVGVAHCVLATDLGDADLPPPVAGFAAFLGEALAAGVSVDELRTMTTRNPRTLLGV